MMKKLFYLLLFFSMALISCEKNEDKLLNNSNSIDNNEPRPTQQVVVEGDLLNFDSWSDFYDVMVEKSQLSYDDKVSWEESLNFTSQEQIFNTISQKEYELKIEPYVDMPAEYFENNPEPDYCTEFYDALEKGIVEVKDEGEGSYIDYTVKDVKMTGFINEGGFIIIDSVLYQYKGDKVKSMENGTIGDCTLLDATLETNEDLGIKVRGVDDIEGEGEFKHFNSWGDNSNVKRYEDNAYVMADFLMSINGGTTPPNTTEYTQELICNPFFVIMYSFIKNGWGNWVCYHGEYHIDGSTRVDIQEGYSYGPTNPHQYANLFLNFQSIDGNTGASYFPKVVGGHMNFFNNKNGPLLVNPISKLWWCDQNYNPLHCDVSVDIAGGVDGIVVNIDY